MEDFVRDLCIRYDIDGLHLDYIRYNHLLYGWSEEDMALYAAAGADIAHLRSLMDRTFLGETPEETCIFDALRAGDASAAALAKVRREDVRRFASALCAAARAQRSGLTLSAALMPEGAYADTAFADLHYGQNYDDAAKLYDYVLPMAYSKAYDKDGAWMRTVAEGTLAKGVKTVMGLHAYEGGTALTLREDIDALEGSGIDGVCLFREGAFVMAFAEGKKLTLVNTTEKSVTRILTGGEYSLTLEPQLDAGEEREFLLPHEADVVQAFCGDAEICVYSPSC